MNIFTYYKYLNLLQKDGTLTDENAKEILNIAHQNLDFSPDGLNKKKS